MPSPPQGEEPAGIIGKISPVSFPPLEVQAPVWNVREKRQSREGVAQRQSPVFQGPVTRLQFTDSQASHLQ